MGVTKVLQLSHHYLLRPVRHALEATEAHLQNEVDQGHLIKIDFYGRRGIKSSPFTFNFIIKDIQFYSRKG